MDEESSISISDLEQWRLLVDVCPLFEYDHPWTALGSDKVDVRVVQNQADLFKAHIKEIPVHIPTDHVLTEKTREEFEREIDTLLFNLECLVDSAKLPASAMESANTTQPTPTPGLSRRYPNLLALSRLMLNCRESTSLKEYGQYFHLVQDAVSFKRSRYAVQRFHDSASSLLSSAAPAPTQTPSTKALAAQPQSRFSHSFWSGSKRLFESLVTHLNPCDENHAEQKAKYSEHKAMLHLKGSQSSEDSELCPEVCIMLASCPDRNTWHQTHCTILPKCEDPSSTTSNTIIASICQEAEKAYKQERVFSIQLRGTDFLDMSDLVFGNRPAHPEADPTKSLSDLLTNKILKDPYMFWPSDKKILAFTLAYALLQLYEGPWIQTLLTSGNIFFLYEASTYTVYNIHQPYISCILSNERPSLGTLNEGHRYPLILSFAKLLLELESGEEMKAAKAGRSTEPSLLISLWEYCTHWSRRQLDEHYAEALEACVNFQKYLRQDQEDNPKTTIQDVILNHIVHPLERRLDMLTKAEWGLRNLDLKARISTAEQSANVILAGFPQQRPFTSDSSRVDTFGATMQRSAVTHVNTCSGCARTPNTPTRSRYPGPSKARAVLKSIKTTAGKWTNPGRLVQSMKVGGGLPSTVSSNLAPENPAFKPVKSMRQKSVALKESSMSRHPNHTQAPQERPSNSVDGETKGLIQTSKYTSNSAKIRPVREVGPQRLGGENRDGRSISPNPQRGLDNNIITPPRAVGSTIHSEFGMCSLSIPTTSGDISTTSFNYINMTVDTRLLRNSKDKAVRVAILDTGLDRNHEDFKQARTKKFLGGLGNIANPAENEVPQNDRIKGCRDFCGDGADNDDDGDDDDDDVEDLNGHGTQVAGIILRLTPHTELYVARVCTGDSNVGVPEHQSRFQRPRPNVVAQAIRWAIRRGVHIINLSLGFRNCTSEELRDLRSALEEAQVNKIVVFAATSNEGAHESVAWPANDARYAIGVHSCKDSGSKKSDFTGEACSNGTNFLVVGEKVLSQWLTAQGGGFRLCTGSSFATPVATAIGALVLAFVWQAVCREEREEAIETVLLDDIRTNSGMTKILKAISTQEGGYWSLNTQLFWKKYRPFPDATKDEFEAKRHAWSIIKEALRP